MLAHLNECSEDSFEMNAKPLWIPEMVVVQWSEMRVKRVEKRLKDENYCFAFPIIF